MRPGRRESASFMLAAAIVAVGAAALVAWPGAPEPVDAAREPRAQANALRFEHEHAFVTGPSRVTFEVPANPRPADVRLWFEGTTLGFEGGAIALLDPDGQPVLETRRPGGNVVTTTGRSNVAALDAALLAPGTWTLAYDGRGAFTGHATVSSA